MELSATDIQEINKECPSEQGVFKEPYAIPSRIKEPVIYMRWETGGVSGGSCWDSSNPRSYTKEDNKPKFKVLDLVLKRLKPDISYLDFREIESLVQTNWETEYEYYGNNTEWKIEYIILSDLYKKLEEL